MKEYVAYLEQDAEGCDYTIGCGKRLWAFAADNHEEALKKLKLKMKDNFNYMEAMLESVTIYEVNSYNTVDVASIYAEINKSEEQITLEEKEAEERSELKRLKQKYE